MGARCTVVIVGLHYIVVVSGALRSLRLTYQSRIIHYLSRKFKLNSNKITHTSQQDSRHHCVISIITILKTTPILNYHNLFWEKLNVWITHDCVFSHSDHLNRPYNKRMLVGKSRLIRLRFKVLYYIAFTDDKVVYSSKLILKHFYDWAAFRLCMHKTMEGFN